MKESPLELTLLYDCYSGMLTEKQQTCFDLYFNQDLSLSEIAEECGISRQGVHDTLARTEAALTSMEKQLGCVKQQQRLRLAVTSLNELAEALGERDPETACRLRAIAEEMEKE